MKAKLILFFLAILAFSCSDNESKYKCKDCVSTPEAAAVNDASGKGIYKGLVVGSSGTIKFNIANSGSTLTATLVIDGDEYELTTQATYNSGFEGYFYGTMNTTNDISIGFWVSSDGTDFGYFGVVIPGHPDVQIELYKELSDALVKVYEGTYSGDDSGTFNMVVQDNKWIVATGDGDPFYGVLVNGAMSCVYCGEVEITGKVGAEEISGNWNVPANGDKGSWKGKRTL